MLENKLPPADSDIEKEEQPTSALNALMEAIGIKPTDMDAVRDVAKQVAGDPNTQDAFDKMRELVDLQQQMDEKTAAKRAGDLSKAVAFTEKEEA